MRGTVRLLAERLDLLERQLQRARDPNVLDQIDAERVRDLLGEQAYRSLEQLKQLTKMLEEAGQWREGQNTVLGLRKVKSVKLAGKKKAV